MDKGLEEFLNHLAPKYFRKVSQWLTDSVYRSIYRNKPPEGALVPELIRREPLLFEVRKWMGLDARLTVLNSNKVSCSRKILLSATYPVLKYRAFPKWKPIRFPVFQRIDKFQ